MGHIERAGVRRHYPALLPEEIAEAARLYQSGQSLVTVGEHFGVNVSANGSAQSWREYEGLPRTEARTKETRADRRPNLLYRTTHFVAASQSP
jgi:hypothetical protein